MPILSIYINTNANKNYGNKFSFSFNIENNIFNNRTHALCPNPNSQSEDVSLWLFQFYCLQQKNKSDRKTIEMRASKKILHSRE